MTFEEVLPQTKAGKKAIRKGWSSFELFAELRDETDTSEGEFLQVTLYLLVKIPDEGYSMFSPTPCDALVEDWVIVKA